MLELLTERLVLEPAELLRLELELLTLRLLLEPVVGVLTLRLELELLTERLELELVLLGRS